MICCLAKGFHLAISNRYRRHEFESIRKECNHLHRLLHWLSIYRKTYQEIFLPKGGTGEMVGSHLQGSSTWLCLVLAVESLDLYSISHAKYANVYVQNVLLLRRTSIRYPFPLLSCVGKVIEEWFMNIAFTILHTYLLWNHAVFS